MYPITNAQAKVLSNQSFLIPIFKYLELPDLLTVAKVCKKWKEISDKFSVSSMIRAKFYFQTNVTFEVDQVQPIVKIKFEDNRFAICFGSDQKDILIEKYYSKEGHQLWEPGAVINRQDLAYQCYENYKFLIDTKKNKIFVTNNETKTDTIIDCDNKDGNLIDCFQFIQEESLLITARVTISYSPEKALMSKEVSVIVYDFYEERFILDLTDPDFMFEGDFFQFYENHLFVGCEDGIIKVFDLEGNLKKVLTTLSHQPDQYSAISAIYIKNLWVIAGDIGGTVHIWNLSENSETTEEINNIP